MGNSEDQYGIPLTFSAISFSDELSLYFYQSTFLLSMIIGIPAIIYGVRQFIELGEKTKTETQRNGEGKANQ